MTHATKPTAAEIDDLCIAFDAAKIAIECAEQDYSEAKGPLLAAVRSFGYVPANAEKTTRLEGTVYVANCTVGSSIAVVEDSVGTLERELSRLNMPKVFNELFERQVKHALKKEAAGTLKLAVGGLDPKEQARIVGLFASCFTVNAKAPALTVDLAAALRLKEEEAEAKATAKAAKAAKKAGK